MSVLASVLTTSVLTNVLTKIVTSELVSVLMSAPVHVLNKVSISTYQTQSFCCITPLSRKQFNYSSGLLGNR